MTSFLAAHKVLEFLKGILGQREKLRLTRIATYEEYLTYKSSMADEYKRRQQIERALVSSDNSFTVPGYCFVCGKDQHLHVDFSYSYPIDGDLVPNWREHLKCPSCHLNNRMRAAIHIIDQECARARASRMYITEQSTPLFRAIHHRYPNTIGSEYLGSTLPLGKVDENGVRNESIANLTFPSESLDHILSFDVLEHVPEYRKGFAECFRCLKPGGTLLFSIPFTQESDTIIRARLNSDGTITHVLPPEFHGDPLNAKGCLCFYHFGWDVLGCPRAVGFQNVAALFFWSEEYGYIGNSDQYFFLAQKPN